MHVPMHGVVTGRSVLPREVPSQPSQKLGGGDFASLIEAQIGGRAKSQSEIAPPVGGGAGNGGISAPIGGADISNPVGQQPAPSGISTMVGNFLGNPSMLADLVTITGNGTVQENAVEAQSLGPEVPPVESESAKNKVAIEAMRAAGTLFAPVNSLPLLNEI